MSDWTLNDAKGEIRDLEAEVARLREREATLRRICENKQYRLDNSWSKEAVRMAYLTMHGDPDRSPDEPDRGLADFEEEIARAQDGV